MRSDECDHSNSLLFEEEFIAETRQCQWLNTGVHDGQRTYPFGTEMSSLKIAMVKIFPFLKINTNSSKLYGYNKW